MLLRLALGQDFFERFNAVGFGRRLIPADAVDAGEAHGDARAVPFRALQALEGDLEYEAAVHSVRHLAHRSEAVDGVVADIAVELRELLVREAEVRLADRHQLVALRSLAPDPERVVGVEGRALSVTALGVHHDCIHKVGISLPLVPKTLRTARHIGAVGALDHAALDGLRILASTDKAWVSASCG